MNEVEIKNMFASRLKSLREEKGMSQVKLAEELGVSRGSVSYYENSDRMAGIDFIFKAAQYFNCTSDYLLGLSNVKFNAESEKDLMIKELEEKLIDLNVLKIYSQASDTMQQLYSIIGDGLFMELLASVRRGDIVDSQSASILREAIRKKLFSSKKTISGQKDGENNGKHNPTDQ